MTIPLPPKGDSPLVMFFMEFDFDDPKHGVCDCPKCGRLMQRLRDYLAIERNEGYMLEADGEDRTGWFYFWFGTVSALIYRFYRYVAQPLAAKRAGDLRQERLGRLQRAYPQSLICLHCKHILKRK